MCTNENQSAYSPEEFRECISILINKIEDPEILWEILDIIGEIFCKT